MGVGGIVPVSAGLFGVLFGFALTGERDISVSADSHFRYLSGLLLGLGLCFWATIPRIEERTTLFRFLSCIVPGNAPFAAKAIDQVFDLLSSADYGPTILPHTGPALAHLLEHL